MVLQWYTCHYGKGWWGERILSQMTVVVLTQMHSTVYSLKSAITA